MLALLLLACSSAHVSSSVEDCKDYDFTGEQESTLESSVDGNTADVWRTYVERENTDDAFAPDIVDDGGVISVYEAWEEGSDGNPMCVEPHVNLSEMSGEIEVRWYLDAGDSVPFNTVRVQAG